MYKMDWDRYYQDQINKSNYNRLNKVSDFTGNQTESFIRSFGTKGQEGRFLNPFWGVQKLSQQVSSLIADETKNETLEKFINNQNEEVKNEMIKVKNTTKKRLKQNHS